jgi:hypothetical protein
VKYRITVGNVKFTITSFKRRPDTMRVECKFWRDEFVRTTDNTYGRDGVMWASQDAEPDLDLSMALERIYQEIAGMRYLN